MNKIVILAAAFFSAAVLKAQSVGVIRGVVIDEITEAPIASCEILSNAQKIVAISKLDGTFELKNSETTTVEFRHPDYSSKKVEISTTQFNRVTLVLSDIQLDGVNISSKKDQGSELSARLSEKTSLTTKNIISSQEIDISPDITVANVIQRVSGISIERNNNGDGQHAIVRGMDKRYNYTLVNGIKIPSPDNKTDTFHWIFFRLIY